MRYDFYKKRKAYLINQLEKELRHLGNKERFIQEVVDKKLNIMNVDEEVLVMVDCSALSRGRVVNMRNERTVCSAGSAVAAIPLCRVRVAPLGWHVEFGACGGTSMLVWLVLGCFSSADAGFIAKSFVKELL